MVRSLTCAVVLIAAVCMAGCATPKGSSPAEKRQFVDGQTAKTLEAFYEARPQLRSKLASAGGYAVFSTVNVKFLLLGTGHGYGRARRADGAPTYMRMAQLGAGPGLGMTDVRLLFVFADRAAFQRFVDMGIEFSGRAEAAATSGGAGVAVGASGAAGGGGVSADAGGKLGESMAASTGAGMEIYRLTQAGVTLQAQVAGTKYWKDGKLN